MVDREPNPNLRSSKLRRLVNSLSTGIIEANTAQNAITSPFGQKESAKNLQNLTQLPHPPTSPQSADDRDPISSLDAQLLAIAREVTQTNDPVKLQELAQATTLLRKFRKNELSASRLRRRHRQDRLKPSRRKRKFEADSAAKQFDPVELLGGLQRLVNQYPTLARLTAERMGIDDLEEVLFRLGRILNDPRKKNAITQYVGNGLAELVRNAIMKFDPSKPTHNNEQQTTSPRARIIDPRYPYALRSD